MAIAVEEPGYGDKIQRETMTDMNPLPEGQAAVAPEAIAQEAVSPPPPPPQSAPPRQAAQNPYMRLPPEVTMASAGERKTPIQQQYDVGLLWDALAKFSTDPTIRGIAKSMTGRGE